VLVRPVERASSCRLLYADEIKKIPVGIDDQAVKDAELGLAIQLVEQIASDEFHPERYEDEVRKRLLEAIQRKVEGQEVTAAAPEHPRAQIIDLMEALKASLGKKAAAGEARAEAAKAAPARAPKQAAGGRRG
jgi:DNA end-binding protein Ku